MRHAPRKRFGQNFLVDAHHVARIVAAIDPKPGQTIVEIGPGQAALTGALIERAGHVTAIEIDRDLAAALRERFPATALTLVVGDALNVDLARFGNDLRIVGNLPYNISSPLLFHLAAQVERVCDITVMLQREVVERMTAAPATPEYGRLTVMLQSVFAIARLFVVPPGAFRPAPKVESAVARLTPLREQAPAIADQALFARIVAAAFSQRRKTLRNALASLCSPQALQQADIDPGARGETLTVADYARLANNLAGGAK